MRTGATPGDVIKVYDGNDVVGSVTVGADGRWNYTIPHRIGRSHA
ncbi:hypothetical protein ACW7EJ_04855 [Acinetobacter soli]